MKKIIGVLCMFFICCNISYAIDNVSIEIPTFDITINNMQFDNEKATYPLIVYSDITYFPMTYNLCRELGIQVVWSNKDGLNISKEKETYPIQRDLDGNNLAGSKYIASISNYNIILNGIQIDNTKEEYPILNFRDITYFPLTWRFAHDELNWEISWSIEEGLKVTRDGSVNAKVYFDQEVYYAEKNGEYEFPNIYVEPYENSLFTISSSNPQVAYYYKDLIYTFNEGETIFTVTSENGLKGQFRLVVRNQENNGALNVGSNIYTINMNTAQLAGKNYVGDVKTISATIMPLTRQKEIESYLEWSSSDSSVATVQGVGSSAVVYFWGKGMTIIKVTAPNGTSSFKAITCEERR